MVFLRLKKSKSGFATIVGGVIILAVIFTVITPLFFYMNTLNNLYDSIAIEMRDLDQQRDWEKVDVFAWIPDEQPARVSVTLTNEGPIAVNIARIWFVPNIGDPKYDWVEGGGWEENMLVKPGEAKDINNDDINLKIDQLDPTTGYHFKIVTARGNLFFSSPLYEIPNGGVGPYDYPIYIHPVSSDIKQSGTTFDITLWIQNLDTVPLYIKYVVISGIIEATGPGGLIPPVVKIDYTETWFDPSPNAVPMEPIPPLWMRQGTDIIKVELVGGTEEPYNYIIGACYFIEWEGKHL